jgi:beta-galactosidase GanA
MGRVNYGPRIPDQRKGIIGNVTIGAKVLSSWEIFPLPMASPPTPTQYPTFKALNSSVSGPVFYSGTFDVDGVGDTFLELSGWTKGVVWVNGENLGRYWTVGPQQSLYLPGCYLKSAGNEISVLALEPSKDQSEVRGVTTRKWGNNPDPDAP